MDQIPEMLENPSDDDDDIESGDVIIVRPEPLYHTDGEEGNDEEICEQEVNNVSVLLQFHTVKKSRSKSRFH